MNFLYSFPVTVLVFLAACSQPQQKSSAAGDSIVKQEAANISSSAPSKPKYNFTDPRFILEEHKHKFHTGRIEKFDDEFLKQDETGSQDNSLYPVLDRESFDVFQSNEKVEDALNDRTPYYYAIQHEGYHTGIIIKQMTDAWIDEYIYLAYDDAGKLVGMVILAGEGGDGGYRTMMTGEFINDSVFIKKTIETEHDFAKEVDKVLVNTTDEITIHFDGKIESRTLK